MFFVIEDEDRFFKWLYSLPAYENVVGQGTTLQLRAGPICLNN